MLVKEPNENGYTSIEIDESSIIANSQVVYSMFGLIQRSSKDAHIFYVINNRTKEKLLPYVINNATLLIKKISIIIKMWVEKESIQIIVVLIDFQILVN